jgi:hypothetical protein
MARNAVATPLRSLGRVCQRPRELASLASVLSAPHSLAVDLCLARPPHAHARLVRRAAAPSRNPPSTVSTVGPLPLRSRSSVADDRPCRASCRGAPRTSSARAPSLTANLGALGRALPCGRQQGLVPPPTRWRQYNGTLSRLTDVRRQTSRTGMADDDPMVRGSLHA